MRRLKLSAEVAGAWFGLLFTVYIYVSWTVFGRHETELDILVMISAMSYTIIMASMRLLQMSEFKRIAPVLYWGMMSMAGLVMFKLVTWG